MDQTLILILDLSINLGIDQKVKDKLLQRLRLHLHVIVVLFEGETQSGLLSDIQHIKSCLCFLPGKQLLHLVHVLDLIHHSLVV